MMELSFLSHISYTTVLIAAIIYFVIGSLWFSGLFRSMWVKELENHKVIIKQPTGQEIGIKMLTAFVCNFVTAFGVACLIEIVGSTTIISGLILGIIAAICFAGTTVANIFNWENRSIRLFLLDAGYPMISIIILTIFFSWWR